MEKYSRLNIAELRSLLIRRNAKTTGKKAELVERLLTLDSVRQQTAGGAAGTNVRYDGEDSVQWPDGKGFAPVSATVPKSDINIAKVGVYFQVHNMSVSRGSKVQKSGYSMFKEAFMSTCAFKVEGGHVFFRAAIFAEMRKDMLYSVECRVTDGEISFTYCECTAGRGPHAICKHVAVMLYNLEHYERSGDWILARSCTDRAQAWPSQPKKRKLDPNVPLTPCEILGREESQQLQDPRPPKYRGMEPAVKRQRLEMMLVNYTSTKKELLHLSEMCGGKADVRDICHDHDYLDKPLLDTWVDNVTKVTADQASAIEVNTRGQAKSALWKSERQLRLTASSAHRVCHVNKNKEACARALFDGPSLGNIPAVRWGQANESAALRKYEEVTGREVAASGLRVCVGKPFLAASPDGECADRLVEVKCPYKKEVRESDDLLQSGYKPITVDENGDACLKVTHPYYYQIQLQLYVTGHQLCDFVVYTPRALCIISVPRDETLISDMVASMETFYQMFYRNVVAEKLFARSS